MSGGRGYFRSEGMLWITEWKKHITGRKHKKSRGHVPPGKMPFLALLGSFSTGTLCCGAPPHCGLATPCSNVSICPILNTS